MGKKLLLAAALMSAAFSFASYSGTWNGSDATGWTYTDDSGALVKDAWVQGATGAWYYLGSDGIMLHDTTTPDGYTVGSDGAWIQNQETTQQQLNLTNSDMAVLLLKSVLEGVEVSTNAVITNVSSTPEYNWFVIKENVSVSYRLNASQRSQLNDLLLPERAEFYTPIADYIRETYGSDIKVRVYRYFNGQLAGTGTFY